MAAPRNDQIQEVLITKLKAMTAVTSELVNEGSSAAEIRENEWEGDEFTYPNVRIRMISNVPDGDTAECSICSFEVSFMVFTQDFSSLECDKIAGIIQSSLNGRTFSANNIEIFLRTTNLLPAIRSDIRTWRAECLAAGKAAT